MPKVEPKEQISNDIELKPIFFKGYRCFKNDFAGFEKFKRLNIIIGRNNTGKSSLLDLLEAYFAGSLLSNRWE